MPELNKLGRERPIDDGVDFDIFEQPLMPREELIAGLRKALEAAPPEEVEEIQKLLRVFEGARDGLTGD